MADKPEWPERIYLQREDDDASPEETTWCRDKINDSDIEYVRADLRDTQLGERDKRIAELEAGAAWDLRRQTEQNQRIDELEAQVRELQGGQQFLMNGARFKLTFNASGQVGCFAGYESDLSGRWVALVDATDNQHCAATPQAQEPKP